MSRKLLVNDGRAERELLLVGTMAVGRDLRCDISDANPLLSRRHAEFEATAGGVTVRDLESRNGILVNGKRTTSTVLHPGDVVKVGNLSITFIEDVAPAVSTDKPADDDATVLVSRAGGDAPGAAADRGQKPATAPPRAPHDDDDGTRVMAPPVRRDSIPASPPVSTGSSPRTAQQRPPQASDTHTRPQRPAHAAVELPLRKGRSATTSWAARVMIFVLGLAAAVFIVTASLLQIFQSRVVDSIGVARATAITNWLAGDAAAYYIAGQPLTNAADAVVREPGVVNAAVMALDGQVLAPASRATEKFETIPTIGESPSNIFRLRAVSHGGLIEVVRPIGVAGKPRVAVAWVTFRSTIPAEAGSVWIVLGPSLFFAVVGGLVVAGLLTRMTTGALVAFNEDIDLAVSGQLSEVRDPLGAKPLQDLANTVNYLIARLKGVIDGRAVRTTAAGGGAGAVAQGPRPAVEQYSQHDLPAPPMPRTARIEADRQFRVTGASPECAELVGVRSDAMIGRHLIDAIPDQVTADAVLKCIGGLTDSGEQSVTVTPNGRDYRLALTVSRKPGDQSIAIGIRMLETAHS